ncbi:MAG: hypothetical protein IKV94_00335 [Clostridia bacterium]|nr:hypothetical protein [Clostridia bacterium]
MSTVYLNLESGKTKLAYCSVSSIFDSNGKLIGKFKNNVVYSVKGDEIGSTVENFGYYYSARYFNKLNSNTIFSPLLNKHYMFDGDSEEALACCIAYFHQSSNNQKQTNNAHSEPRQYKCDNEEKFQREFVLKKPLNESTKPQSNYPKEPIKLAPQKPNESKPNSSGGSDAPLFFGILGILFVFGYIVVGFQQWQTFFKDLTAAELSFTQIISKHNGLLVPISAALIGCIASHILHAKKFAEFFVIYFYTFIAVILLVSIIVAIFSNFWMLFLAIFGYVCVSWYALIVVVIIDYLITRFILA